MLATGVFGAVFVLASGKCSRMRARMHAPTCAPASPPAYQPACLPARSPARPPAPSRLAGCSDLGEARGPKLRTAPQFGAGA
eukprot:14319779-Alexandrium_andersonii.AAC.1